MRSLDHPTSGWMPIGITRLRDGCIQATLGNVHLVPALGHLLTGFRIVIPLVGAQMLFLLFRIGAFHYNGVDGVCRLLMSWRLAPESVVPMGIPPPSVIRWRLLPLFPRSVGWGLVSSPPKGAFTVALSRACRSI